MSVDGVLGVGFARSFMGVLGWTMRCGFLGAVDDERWETGSSDEWVDRAMSDGL